MHQMIIDKFLEQLKEPQPQQQEQLTPVDIKKLWIAIGTKLNPNYLFDDVSATILLNCFADKGAVFFGNKGIGKSLNMDILHRLQSGFFKQRCQCWEANELETAFRINGAAILDEASKCDTLILNEIGLESTVLKDYGTDRNVVAEMLYLRYRSFQLNKQKTFLTCNLTPTSINERYGPRLADRFKEMFNFIELKGESKRI